MTTWRRFLSGLLVAAVLVGPVATTATATPRTPSAHRSSHKKNDRPKIVHVRSYKKKNGTVVKAHDRATPQPK